MSDGNQALVVHVQSQIEFDMQHITASVNIPITEINTTNMLPHDRYRPLVFYWMGLCDHLLPTERLLQPDNLGISIVYNKDRIAM